MALFKISKGLKANLPSAKTAGYCWYTTDDSLFYIDYEDANGVVQRKALNAKDAETLMGASLATILNSSDIEIPTSKAVLTALAGKANTSHNHNDIYYTETEVDTKLASKSDTSHKHDGIYDAKGAAATVQQNLNAVSDALSDHTENSDIHVTAAKKTNWDAAYTHSQSTHARVDATKVADSTTNGNILINGTETNVYSHPNSGVSAGTYKSVTVNAQGHVTAGSNPTTLSGYGITDAETKSDASAKLTEAKTYADTAANKVKNDLLNGAGAAYDTLKELGELIDDNKDAIDALEDVASGKADKVHSHAISDITNLQTTLDGKAAASHGTHVTYSTTAPVMDGTAAVGTAATVARSDHKHPTDTSRAAKTDLDTHTGNTTVHITATERTNWGAAYTHSQSAHAPSNAEKNQNAFSNIAVSGQTTVSADTTTDTVTFAGSNVTITTDATNDKVTFAVADGTTSAKGVVQLTNSTSSTSTTTAATPNSVKTAYDLANTTKTSLEAEITRAKAAEAQHLEDTSWKIIYDSKAITSNVNAFYGIDIAGYKKLKVAIKCVNTTSSEGTSAVEVAFMGEGYIYYYFTNLFPSLIASSTSTTSAMAEFTMTDGFVFCDNVLKSTSATNMFSSGEGLGVWNMTSLGGGIMTCNSPFFYMDVTAANDSMSHYFGAGSRVIVWGCKE